MDRTSTVVVSVAVVFMGAMVWKGVQEPRAPAGFVERANRAPVTTTKLTNTQVVGPIDTPIVERPARHRHALGKVHRRFQPARLTHVR